MAGRLATALAFFKINSKNTFVYRGMLVLWLLSWFLHFTLMYFVWHAARINGQIGNFNLRELITYYFLGTFVVAVSGWYPFYFLSEKIKDGSIAQFLIKPINFFWYNIGSEVGWHFINTLFYLIFFIFVYLLIRDELIFPAQKMMIFWFVLSLIIAALVSLEVNLILVCFAFWLTNASGLGALFWMALSLFGGQFLPLSFFPAFVQKLLFILPFRFMYSFPLEIFLAKINSVNLIFSFLVGFFWLISLYFLFNFLWRRGVRSYTAFGQ